MTLPGVGNAKMLPLRVFGGTAPMDNWLQLILHPTPAMAAETSRSFPLRRSPGGGGGVRVSSSPAERLLHHTLPRSNGSLTTRSHAQTAP